METYHSDLFVLLVDLKKVYDSVLCPVLWRVLERLGIPSTMISIIQSFHEGMSVKVIVGQKFTESFDVCNGLHQGCTISPVLFSLYFGAGVDDWRSKYSTGGVKFRYTLGRKLVGDRTGKSQLLLDITDSQFADDAALYATSEESFVTVTQSFANVASGWGLTVSLIKTKGMKIGDEPRFVNGVPVHDQLVEMVREFPYLGSTDGEVDSDVKIRISKAAKAFGCLKKPIFTNHHLSVNVGRAVYKAIVLATLLYGLECWAVKASQLRCLEVFHYRCVRCLLGITQHQQWTGHITDDTLLREFEMTVGLSSVIMERRMRWLEHICRMDVS